MVQLRLLCLGLFFCFGVPCLATPLPPAGQDIWVTKYRHYFLHVPPGWRKGERLPVWLMAPGSSDTASVFQQMSNAIPLADKHHFALAVLEGAHLNLNVASKGQPVPWGPDDITYTKLVLRNVVKRIDVDLERIRCIGFSRGGRFCSRLASELSSFVSAIAPVSGLRFPRPNNATRPMPIIAFHGTRDPINPFAGNGNPQYWHEPVLEAVQKWADKNKCMRYKEHKMSHTVTYCLHLDCEDNADVILVKIDGGGHTWPGTSWVYRPPWRFGAISHELDATIDIFNFFKKHHRPSRCHTAVKGEECYQHVQWVRNKGLRTQHQLYGSLKNTSTVEEIQLFLHQHIYANCPRPCHLGRHKRTEMFVGRSDQQPVRVSVQSRSSLVPITSALAGTVMGLFVFLTAIAALIRLQPRICCIPDLAFTARHHCRAQQDKAPLMEAAPAAPTLNEPPMHSKTDNA